MRLYRKIKPAEALRGIAAEEWERLLDDLPSELATAARTLPIVCEGTPNEALVRTGVAAGTFGLFIGSAYAEPGASPVPSQILLFLENLWAAAHGNEERFREEVRRTLLHELGHYLGLDEDGLSARGLD